MARRKGKSQRKVKDWHIRYRAGEKTADDDSVRQKVQPRAVKLPASRLVAPEENLENLPKVEGMVAGLFPGGALVRTNARELLCAVAKTYRAPEGASPITVGDDVTVALARPERAAGGADADKVRADGLIISRQPRRTALSRPQPRSAKRTDRYETEITEKVIVANADLMLIVASTVQPALRHGLIDRFLIIAERGGLEPVLAVNKIDLARPEEAVLTDLRRLQVRLFLCSAVTGEGLDALREALAGRRTVLAGASGVGKSKLINALVPGADAATREIRAKDHRGRHTTTAAAVYDLPGGGLLVDTPGLRELGLGLKAAELPWYFPEFEPFAPKCRFRDCSHSREPGCAVQAAVAAGDLPPRRYEGYLRILETIRQR